MTHQSRCRVLLPTSKAMSRWLFLWIGLWFIAFVTCTPDVRAASWTSISPSGGGWLTSAAVSTTGVIYAGCDVGGVYRSSTWVPPAPGSSRARSEGLLLRLSESPNRVGRCFLANDTRSPSDPVCSLCHITRRVVLA
jgi:hypothetical protein